MECFYFSQNIRYVSYIVHSQLFYILYGIRAYVRHSLLNMKSFIVQSLLPFTYIYAIKFYFRYYSHIDIDFNRFNIIYLSYIFRKRKSHACTIFLSFFESMMIFEKRIRNILIYLIYFEIFQQKIRTRIV